MKKSDLRNYFRFYHHVAESPYSHSRKKQMKALSYPVFQKRVTYSKGTGYGISEEAAALDLLKRIRFTINNSKEDECISVLDLSLPEQTEHGYKAEAQLLTRKLKEFLTLPPGYQIEHLLIYRKLKKFEKDRKFNPYDSAPFPRTLFVTPLLQERVKFSRIYGKGVSEETAALNLLMLIHLTINISDENEAISVLDFGLPEPNDFSGGFWVKALLMTEEQMKF